MSPKKKGNGRSIRGLALAPVPCPTIFFLLHTNIISNSNLDPIRRESLSPLRSHYPKSKTLHKRIVWQTPTHPCYQFLCIDPTFQFIYPTSFPKPSLSPSPSFIASLLLNPFSSLISLNNFLHPNHSFTLSL